MSCHYCPHCGTEIEISVPVNASTRIVCEKCGEVMGFFAEERGTMPDYSIPSELVERVIKTLPNEWCLRIELSGHVLPPGLVLTDDVGEDVADTSPCDGETLAACIERVLAEALEDDEE